ncbi:hypothetical protein ILUMI_13229 [Ignelater luminosus]|uniref:Uncharacterized protein n=1 Tax=Ignelater luminosus TaxID=2038154 RepID=A0A8K0G607_IGNLU|nr:hypothetical protein ILUMI_13229 [Ignelater luminosus]
MKSFHLISFSAAAIVCVLATPKKYTAGENNEGGFQPSNLRYYESPLSDNSRNFSIKPDPKETKESTAINRYQRFGSVPLLPPSGYGNTGAGVQGYPPPGGVGYMMPMKIDIGGVALGALLGLGAVLIAPKLMSVFHMVGPGYRSLDSNTSAVTEILSRIDNTLEQHNIDSSSCMQRVICSYVHEAQKNLENGEGSTVDQVISALSNNSLFSYMLDGSAVKQAVDMGKQGDLEKCSSLYMKCPISRDNVMQVIASLLPA